MLTISKQERHSMSTKHFIIDEIVDNDEKQMKLCTYIQNTYISYLGSKKKYVYLCKNSSLGFFIIVVLCIELFFFWLVRHSI